MRNQKSFGHIVEQCTENSRNARVALFVALSSARYWETTMQVKIPEQCSVRENWFSFISSARRLRFHLQHDKDQKVVFLKKRQRKRQTKRKKIIWIFCEMAVLQLFCIILVSSSKFFINDVSAAYSCPIRDEAFELVTGKMFYPYVLTKYLKKMHWNLNYCYERLVNFILWFDRK